MKIHSVVSVLLFALLPSVLLAQTPPVAGGCQIFPTNNIWNTRIDNLPVDTSSNTYISTEGGSGTPLHPDFGTVYNGAPNGLPYVIVPSTQSAVPIVFTAYGSESNPGPYPVPATAPIEGGPTGTGDRHVLVLESGACQLYEMFSAYPQTDGSWQAASGSLFDLTANAPLRPAGWTSADAAGLPIFPGLVRYDEVRQALASDGVLHHALRFTVVDTRNTYLWPARHEASSSASPSFPPMGQRFRLKASANIGVYPGTTTAVSAANQVILQTLKTYGMFVADNGSNFFLSGAPDPDWNDSDLHLLTYYKASDFEAVDESSLMIDPNSGQAVQPNSAPTISIKSPTSGATVSGIVTVAAQAQASAGIASVQFLVDGNTSLGSVNGAGPSYSVSWPTTSFSNATHSLTAVVTDNNGASVTSSAVSVMVANSTALPTSFTTYMAPYGSGSPTFNTTSVVLPVRAYLPAGASQLSYLYADFNATASGVIEYQLLVISDGSGGYLMRLQTSSAVTSFVSLTASGNTVTLPTPISLGTLSLTAYRFALVGNEYQLDVSLTRSGSFNDQVAILAIQSNGAYSSPWNVSNAQWASSAASAPAITLSANTLSFGTQIVGMTASQALTVTSSGSAPLSITSASLGGANAGDFTASNACPGVLSPGASCQITVTFDPLAQGSRPATLSVADSAAGSPQNVALSGIGSSVAMPTTFTTYMGPYGSGAPTLHGTSAILPLRAYVPAGPSQLNYLFADFNTAAGVIEEQLLVLGDGAGGFVMRLQTSSAITPFIPLTASGNTVTLPTLLTLGTTSVSAYRFALVGNEFQLDVSLTRTDNFNDQIALLAIESNGAYSSPWNVSDAQWSNP